MAEWAFGVGIAGFISIFLSFAGIAFVWRSLDLNRRATNAALSMLEIERTRNEPVLYLGKSDKGELYKTTTFYVGNAGASPCVVSNVSVVIDYLDSPAIPEDYPTPTFVGLVLNPFSQTEVPHHSAAGKHTRGQVAELARAGKRKWLFGYLDISCSAGRYRFGFCGHWELYNQLFGDGNFALTNDESQNYCKKL